MLALKTRPAKRVTHCAQLVVVPQQTVNLALQATLFTTLSVTAAAQLTPTRHQLLAALLATLRAKLAFPQQQLAVSAAFLALF
jgi:hypothetical protein